MCVEPAGLGVCKLHSSEQCKYEHNVLHATYTSVETSAYIRMYVLLLLFVDCKVVVS